MPYCEMQPEAARERSPENTWEALGRMVKSMALDAVALQFSQMDQTGSQMNQTGATRPLDHDPSRGLGGNPEVIR